MKRKGPKPKTLAERFWPKVAVAGPDDCWLWLSNTNNQGYPVMTRRWDEPGSSLAYRISWELAGNSVPERHYLHHRCHQPLCCNPSHLQVVTQTQNLLARRFSPNPRHKPVPKPKQPPVLKVPRTCLTCGKTFLVTPSRVAAGYGLFCLRSCVGRSIEERFWRRVTKTDGCWLWIGALVPGGYGQLPRGPKGAGYVMTHRFSWELHCGPIPERMQVLHRCDIRHCVNPAHLFLGTQLDNMRDMHAKGRFRHWSSCA